MFYIPPACSSAGRNLQDDGSKSFFLETKPVAVIHPLTPLKDPQSASFLSIYSQLAAFFHRLMLFQIQ